MAWSDERVAVLKKMWLDGNSASEIAKELGDITRNAVIGKVHRLGLSNRDSNSSKSGSSQTKVAKSLKRGRPPKLDKEPKEGDCRNSKRLEIFLTKQMIEKNPLVHYLVLNFQMMKNLRLFPI